MAVLQGTAFPPSLPPSPWDLASRCFPLILLVISFYPFLLAMFHSFVTPFRPTAQVFFPPTGTLVWNSEILEPLHMANVQSGQQQPKCESPIQQRSDEILAARRMSNGIT